jgi:diadenosine tetraphosphate (Ap4A) HIT family hydrolase
MSKAATHYEALKIKEFNHWILYLHECQSYLGRVYLLACRSSDRDLMDIHGEEREEFFHIGNTFKKGLASLFSPDKLNYAALGNVFDALHVHVIPRYKTKRLFEGIEFVDARWGKNYAPYDKEFVVEPRVLQKIKEAIRSQI